MWGGDRGDLGGVFKKKQCKKTAPEQNKKLGKKTKKLQHGVFSTGPPRQY